jgi:hypothetical protein
MPRNATQITENPIDDFFTHYEAEVRRARRDIAQGRLYPYDPSIFRIFNHQNAVPTEPNNSEDNMPRRPQTTQPDPRYPVSTRYATAGVLRGERERFTEAIVREATLEYWSREVQYTDRITAVAKTLQQYWATTQSMILLVSAMTGVDYQTVLRNMRSMSRITTVAPIVVVPLNAEYDIEAGVPHLTYGRETTNMLRRMGHQLKFTTTGNQNRDAYRAPTDEEVQFVVDSICNAPAECWAG